MILLQAMLGFPIVILGLYFVAAFIFLIIFSLFNIIQSKLFVQNAKRIPLYWAFILSIVFTLIFIVKMLFFTTYLIN